MTDPNPLSELLNAAAADADPAAPGAKATAKRAGAAGTKKKARRATGAEARKAVEDSMAALGEQAEDEAPVGAGADEETPEVAGIDLAPVSRPGGEDYRPRILGETTDVETLRALRVAGIPAMLSGYPGCGKTALVEAAFGDELITVEGNGDLEVDQLVGRYVPRMRDGAISYEWTNGPLVEAMVEGKVLFLDDATLVSPQVHARLYPAMDGRRRITLDEHEGETITAAPGFYVIGAHNPGAPGAQFSEALSSRFRFQIEVESDLRLARELGVDRNIVLAARNLRTRRTEGAITWAPEMRELLAYLDIKRTLGRDLAVNALVSQAPEGDRDVVVEVFSTWYPNAEALRLSEDAS